MLRKVQREKSRANGGAFALVASRYNARYVDAMVRAAAAELKRAGVKEIQVVRVPGAFEIPTVAAELAHASRMNPEGFRGTHHVPLAAIICLGVIFQGQTSHAQHIGWGVTHALAQIQLQHRIPVIHGVFIFEKEEQARVRCLGRKHNRGREAARTALAMARVMARLRRPA
jgi:6,7-dimethyl-8-ribityllumazine synthase